jgi:UDP-N-acetylglucosamine--N-acetylmuramyl-(pentapeptide) pyrophosphoryl-undecaprenol N-acetylglucosamine transferase
MGGFTGAPVVLAARSLGIPVVLHEANAIPGRAHRWLASMADGGLVHFEGARRRWRMAKVALVGMPVREGFEEGGDREACRSMLGLEGHRPVLLAMGGSQGAQALNRRMLEVAPALAERVPGLQVLHLTGRQDEGRVREGYQAAGLTAVVRPFLTEMEVALAAADAVVSRAGASSVAELGALRVPALLIPFPSAADDHQRENARELERAGAARWLDPEKSTVSEWVSELTALLTDARLRERMREGWRSWHRLGADAAVASAVLEVAGLRPSAADGGWVAGVWAT